jgi:hypothetical protein
MGAHGELVGEGKEGEGGEGQGTRHGELLGEGEGHGRWGLDALLVLPVAARVSSAVREKKKRRKEKGEEKGKGRKRKEKKEKNMENFPNLKIYKK